MNKSSFHQKKTSLHTLTHLDDKGEAKMVDVGEKKRTKRVAIARGSVSMKAATLEKILTQTHEKGDVLAVARIAGIMAAKRTSEWIPLCHPIALTSIDVALIPYDASESVELTLDYLSHPKAIDNDVHIVCYGTARTTGQTGVEMEALTAVSATLLTVYDMCKSVDRFMELTKIALLKKSGGKSGKWFNPKYPSIHKNR